MSTIQINPDRLVTDEAAAASAVCAAKSAAWDALRRLNAGEDSSAAVYGQMREVDVAGEEFRATYYPDAVKAFGVGDRHRGQPFEMYVVRTGAANLVWAEATR